MIRKSKFWLALVLLAVLPAFAQNQTGKIHGHAQDPTTAAIKGGRVDLSTDGAGKDVKYTLKLDDNGDFKGENIAPGTYFATLFSSENKSVDQFQNVKITAGNDTLQDFDLSRPEYVKNLSPEQKKQIEEVRKRNSEINKENNQIKNLNEQLKQAREANSLAHKGLCVGPNGNTLGNLAPEACQKAGGTPNNPEAGYQKAETLMLQATQAKPDASVLWVELGTAQMGLKKYDDAIIALKKAVDLDAAAKKPNPEVQGAADNTLGEAYAIKGDVTNAVASYEAAVKVAPANAAMYYTNEAIVMDRYQKIDETVAAADKAIAADPNRAIAYYLKGKALVTKASVDPKTNKIVTPPGCAESYQKYLDLQPNGQFAAEVTNLMKEMNMTVNNNYKAAKTKK